MAGASVSNNNIASSGIVVEALTEDNYENWSALVENYLVGQGLWDDVVVSDRKPEGNQKSEWREKNAKALHAIQLSCGSDTLTQIRKFKTAREAWIHLKASFSEDVKDHPDPEQGREGEQYHYIQYQYIWELHSSVKKGYWNDAKSLINSYPDYVYYSLPYTGSTVLHIAVAAGNESIVKELVKIGNKRLLKMQDKRGYTALALAAELTDNQKLAEWMVDRGGVELLTIKTTEEDKDNNNNNNNNEDDDKGGIPLLLAAARGHKQMTRYLYKRTPPAVLLENSGHYGIRLLKRCLSNEIFDVAAALLQDRVTREIPLTHESDCLRPLYVLAHIPSAFRSGTHLGWWRRLIYHFLWIDYKDNYNVGIEIVSDVEPELDVGPDTDTLAGKIWSVLVLISVPVKHIGQFFFGKFRQAVQKSILLKFRGIEKIYEKKLDHHLVIEILNCLSKRISRSKESELRRSSAYDAMLQAAKYGIIEFIKSMSKANPDLLWATDKNKRGIFSLAIINRQEKVFAFLCKKEGMKEIIASREDVFGNNMLHLAAKLGPSSDLGLRYNAALQMQRELQWFKAVRRMVPPKCKDARNADGKKPRELFTKNHEEVVKAGEKWAKDTAGAFTLVGTLIITIMFAAAFTVPGGNNQETGIPIFLNRNAFTTFIIADAVSLTTSASSVLLFIGILTSRYAERDFCKRLPLKLLFGLITLFLSVASMMCAFCAALYMMLKGYRRFIIVAMTLAVVPVLVFIPSLFRISFEIFYYTVISNSPTSKEEESLSKMTFRRLRVRNACICRC